MSQADTPRLTLVTPAERAPRPTVETVDPFRFLQAITASLDLEHVIGTLTNSLRDLIGQTGWEYRHRGPDLELKGGQRDRHRLEYSLTLNDRALGTLTLMRGRRFSEADQIRIEGLLGLAAPALHNALDYSCVIRLLERDTLTGLGNRRALSGQGSQWLADAIRQHRSLSMLVLDLDGFKVINDTLGHPAGDRLLIDIAEILRANTRAGDLCVRMGGDEFAVLLPGANLIAAMDCADRVRQAVAARAFAAPGADPVKLSVSIGVATHRAGMDLDQLYHQADEALYAAKRAGRNRVLASAGGSGGAVGVQARSPA